MKDISKNDIIQLNGENDKFSFQLMIVDEVRSWGCMCCLTSMDGATVYYRADWDSFSTTGGVAAFLSTNLEVGTHVTYVPTMESGVISSLNDEYVFVDFDGNVKACRPIDLAIA